MKIHIRPLRIASNGRLLQYVEHRIRRRLSVLGGAVRSVIARLDDPSRSGITFGARDGLRCILSVQADDGASYTALGESADLTVAVDRAALDVIEWQRARHARRGLRVPCPEPA